MVVSTHMCTLLYPTSYPFLTTALLFTLPYSSVKMNLTISSSPNLFPHTLLQLAFSSISPAEGAFANVIASFC